MTVTLELTTVLAFITPIITAVVGWWAKTLQDELRAVRADITQTRAMLDAHKLFAAENYIRDTDLQKLRSELIGHFERLERLVNNALSSRGPHPAE